MTAGPFELVLDIISMVLHGIGLALGWGEMAGQAGATAGTTHASFTLIGTVGVVWIIVSHAIVTLVGGALWVMGKSLDYMERNTGYEPGPRARRRRARSAGRPRPQIDPPGPATPVAPEPAPQTTPSAAGYRLRATAGSSTWPGS